MSQLEIRLFGGFDARVDGVGATGFDSQKSRALLAYLALERRKIEREALAALLWSERTSDSARRNLRQTLHSVRNALGNEGARLLHADHHTVWIAPGADLWVDVAAFSEAVESGLSEGGVDPYQLTIAARLYTGDLLAGFYLKECPAFEEWLITQQERLRDEAVAALRALVGAYTRRGEYRFGIQYARRLLYIDPLSEEAHRQLMQLYSLAGHRPRALTQYEKLCDLLSTELGVEPLEETTAVYQQILLEEVPRGQAEAIYESEPVGPLIPLIGRTGSFAELERSWSEVLEGRGRLTLVEGEAGAGKSRLVKSVVDRATARRHAVVLSGRSYQDAPLICYQPIAEMLEGAFADILPYDSEEPPRLPSEVLADLAMLAPRIRQLAAEPSGESFPEPKRADPDRIADSLLYFLTLLGRLGGGPDPTPVVMLLDDLQWSDPASLELLHTLVPTVAERPIWILATRRTGSGRAPDWLAAETGSLPIERLSLGRFDPADVDELAAALVHHSQAPRLAAFLWRASEGLPLAVAELINHLWNESILTPARPGQWHLSGDPARLMPTPEKLNDLIHLRVSRLPNSARRLLSMAATIGQQFDADLLQQAANEHMKVVEVAIELLLESWLIRQFPRSWSQSGRDPDLVLWARGARRGWFQFAHAAIRAATLDHINPLRKQMMHRDLATAMREIHDDDPREVCETLAFHLTAAGEWEAALPCLEMAISKAEACGAMAVAEVYRQQAIAVIDRLAAGDAGDGAVRRLEGARRRLGKSARRGD